MFNLIIIANHFQIGRKAIYAIQKNSQTNFKIHKTSFL